MRFKNKNNIFLHDVEVAACITTVSFILIGLLLRISQIEPDNTFSAISFCLAITTIGIWVLIFFRSIKSGYRIEGNKIIFHKKYRKHEEAIANIKFMIVSNAFIHANGVYCLRKRNLKGKYAIAPWCTIVFDEINEKEAMNIGQSKNMISLDVEEKLLPKHYFYGFVVRDDVAKSILKMYQKKIYIAKSNYCNFVKEIDELCKMDATLAERIVILND